MIRATKTLRDDLSSQGEALSIAEEETPKAALGRNCTENDRSQASLDQTDFPKKFWKNGNMTPLLMQNLNKDAERRAALCLNPKKPRIPLCRQDLVNKTERDFYRNISHNKTGENPLK